MLSFRASARSQDQMDSCRETPMDLQLTVSSGVLAARLYVVVIEVSRNAWAMVLKFCSARSLVPEMISGDGNAAAS